DHALKVGDVVVDEASEGLPKDLGLRVGKMHTSGEIIGNPATRVFLYRSTGAVAGEMENEIVRTAARELGVRYWGVRAISDTAEQSIDPKMMDLIDEVGRTRMGSVMGAMFRGPAFISQMKKMGKQAKTAAGKLGEAVKILVDFWETQG